MNILRPSVYFVDDDAILLEGLRRNLALSKLDWDLKFYSDPLEALQAFRKCPPDIVVSDLQMPELDGLQMLRQMQSSDVEFRTKFIVLTGSGDLSAAVNAINELQVFRFLQKPIARESVIEAIHNGLDELDRSGSGDMANGHAEAALGLINAAIIVATKEGRIVYSNSAGDKMLNSEQGLSIGIDGICRASNSEDTKALHEMLNTAFEDPDDHVRWLTIDQTNDTEQPHSFVAIPQGATDEDRSVVILSTFGQSKSSLNVDVLQSMFGLTPAEAAIALEITMGGKLEDAARQSGITVSSARTYLKRVFGKTGANRQADLVKLILTSPAALVKKQA